MQRGFAPIWMLIGFFVVVLVILVIPIILNALLPQLVRNKLPLGQIASSPSPSAGSIVETDNLSKVIKENGDVWETYYDNNFKYKISYPENLPIETSYKTVPGESLSNGSLILEYGFRKLGFTFNFQGGWCEGGGCVESEFTTNSGMKVKKFTSSSTIYYLVEPETSVLDNVFITSGQEDMVLTEQIIKTMEFE